MLEKQSKNNGNRDVGSGDRRESSLRDLVQLGEDTAPAWRWWCKDGKTLMIFFFFFFFFFPIPVRSIQASTCLRFGQEGCTWVLQDLPQISTPNPTPPRGSMASLRTTRVHDDSDGDRPRRGLYFRRDGDMARADPARPLFALIPLSAV